MLAYLLLVLAQVIGLLMIPFGAPGVWLQIAALGAYGWWTEFAMFGPIPLFVLVIVAVAAELASLVLSSKSLDTQLRRRVGFTGLAGAGAGAAIGIPVPLLGSLFGALLGAFVGSILGTLGPRVERSGCGALGGLLVATSLKAAAGFAAAVFTLFIFPN